MHRLFSSLVLLIGLLACVTLASSQSLVYIDSAGEKQTTGPTSVVLASFGEGTASVSYFYKGNTPDSASVSSGSLYTVGEIIKSTFEDYVNYTIPFTFDKGVGKASYKFTVTSGSDSVSIEGNVIIAGFDILDNGVVVSGDERPGVSVGQDGQYSYKVRAMGTDGKRPSLSNVRITFREMKGPYMKEVKSATFQGDDFNVELNKYRVGTGNFQMNFDAPSITYNGESFETILNVKQATTPVPPCVAVGGSYKIKATGEVEIPMFNLAKPPRTSVVSKIRMTVDGKSYDFDADKSDLGIPDQTVVFRPETTGQATIQCDGEDAVSTESVLIVGPVPKQPTGPLAKDSMEPLSESPKYKTITAVITVVDSDPILLEKKDADAIVAKMCQVIDGKKCVYEKITRGSAVMSCAGYVDGAATDSESKLRNAFTGCTFQSSLDYACDKLLLGKMNTLSPKAVSGAGVSAASAAGLATWVIVVIAVVGAFAIILLVMVGLWAVYRRNAEQSESDYSSSGPLGVPDPSDLLYEQSIVRDIYGRGDFPEGGPSAAAAEARAREADLREEFPRPPSSSGVSRAMGTDDASSTYSV